jgi:hypothetical protein
MKPDPTAYIGYLKIGRGQWFPVCSACTADLCYRLLLDHEPPARARFVSRQVLPRGLEPNLKNERKRLDGGQDAHS